MASARREHPVDRASRYALGGVAALAAIIFGGILFVLLSHSLEAFGHSGFGLITGQVWDPVSQTFGAWPFIWGTIYTSLIALALAVPIGFAVALFLTELSPGWVRAPLSVLVELLAGVPSIVYGIWGWLVLGPLIKKNVAPFLDDKLGWIPLFSHDGGFRNQSILLAGTVLAIMILPTITAIARDALLAVPRLEREAAYALGATRWEVARTALSSARLGLFAAVTLGLGRALGETMAVYFTIGSVAKASVDMLGQGQSIAATLALQINEATDPLFVSALIALGFILFVLTLLVNLGARALVERPWRRSA